MITDLLTDKEREALDLTVDLWRALQRVVKWGANRDNDLREAANHLHDIQHAIMAQAAARAYPDEFRLLGE